LLESGPHSQTGTQAPDRLRPRTVPATLKLNSR
jgi:hypothetical protein